MLPDLLGGEDQHGGDEPHQGAKDAEESASSRAALEGVGCLTIQAILDHVQIEAAHVYRAETQDLVIRHVELEATVRLHAAAGQLGRAGQSPPVQQLELAHGEQVPVGPKAIQVTQQEPGRVADAPVGVRQLLEDGIGDPDVLPVVRRGHQKAQDVGAVTLDDALRCDDVAQRLVHGPPLPVHDEAMGENHPVWGLAPGRHRRQQG